MSNEKPASSFTGRSGQRKARASVKIADRVAQSVISIGGIGTIIAVLFVGVFLFWMVVPLFAPPHANKINSYSSNVEGVEVRRVLADEYRLLGALILETGEAQVFNVNDGQPITTVALSQSEDVQLTASSYAVSNNRVAFGYSDGTIRLGTLGFKSQFFTAEDVPAELQGLEVGESGVWPEKQGMVQVTPEGQFRLSVLEADLKDPLPSGSYEPVVQIDYAGSDTDGLIAVLTEDGKFNLVRTAARKDFFGNVTGLTAKAPISLPYEERENASVKFIGLDSLANKLFLIYDDGLARRLDIRNPTQARLAEEQVLVEPGEKVSVVRFALGRETLLIGYDDGRISRWGSIALEQAEADKLGVELGVDGFAMIQTGDMNPSTGTQVTLLAASPRSRIAMAGFADGTVRMFNSTSNDLLLELDPELGEPLDNAYITGKEDGIFVMAGPTLVAYDFEPKHPSATPTSLFTQVWYEGYAEPAHVWQSTTGEDTGEPKFGMIPLIFGTLKATVYALIFAVPVALLAAIYTSQFMHPRVKGMVKPGIEMMASLPSVVLGFLAGLVIAPFVEDVVPAMLTAILVVPFTLITGAFLWQLMPHKRAILLEQWRFVPILLCLPLGILISVFLGPALENLLFAGDIKQWLAFKPGNDDPERAQYAQATGGWFLLLTPSIGVLVAIAMAYVVNPKFREISANMNRPAATRLNLLKYAGAVASTLLLAFGVASILNVAGFDLRVSATIWGMDLSPVSTYVQRNSLIVGFAMGFAVIPIIFTIADDAMSAVPTHLVSASLGAGATPWQTTMRVVIPTAMSGIFSACMIGLGRAVGETMIVLMAAGNTPVLDLNIFEGFRTLSANIATELPEAPKGGTHYRTLFLSALVLFILTFIVNTFAELIRQRFRKRAVNL